MRNTLATRTGLITILLGLTSSCATIICGSRQTVHLDSSVDSATIYVNGYKLQTTTPCKTAVIRRVAPSEFNRRNEYVYRFEKEGYQPFEYRDKARLNWLVAFDAIYMFPALFIDIAAGSHHIYNRNIYAYLQPITQTDLTAPVIVIASPSITRGFRPVVYEQTVTISGNIIESSKLKEVSVNGEMITVGDNKTFSHTLTLRPGENAFSLRAIDEYNNTSTETFIISREEHIVRSEAVATSTDTELSVKGKFYAIIIANNEYKDPEIASLNEPINDATRLYNTITTKYTFDAENVTMLRNASYVQIIDAFDILSNKLTAEDNLIVFYAGHGWWDESKNLGYWLPTDAKKSSTAYWIPNSRISDYMATIPAKHTLLIADACFSGSKFKTRTAFSDAQPAINKLYSMPSKKAMTSGNLKVVPDKSVFLHYLVKRLDENADKYVSSDVLFTSFRIAVMNNSNTEPQYGTMQNTGDEGGEFIFVRR